MSPPPPPPLPRPYFSVIPNLTHATQLPLTEAVYARSTWCRPLSGCSSAAPLDGPAACSSTAPPPAAELLPPIVALGKFDALHKGHRALAAAAADLGGAPWLVSFSGMAEVLGWPARLPLVAPCDRRRVLASWAQDCRGRTPRECAVPFAEVGCCNARD